MIAPPIYPPVPVFEASAVVRYRDEELLHTASNLSMLHGSFFSPAHPPAYVWLDARAFAEPSEENFARLALEAPETLVVLLVSNMLRPSDLTFAAEAAGQISDSEMVRAPLLALLNHEAALVREGAVYGLARHLSAEVRTRLQEVAGNDPSPGVREAARETLETRE